MTVNTNQVKSTYTGNGLATTHNLTIRPILDSDGNPTIKATHVVVATGIETPWVLDTDFSLDMNTFVVTALAGPLPLGEKVVFTYNMPFKQPIDIQNEGFYPERVESGLDDKTLTDLQLKEEIGRAVKVPVGSDLNSDDILTDLLEASAAAQASAAAAAVSEQNSENSAVDAAQSALAAQAAAQSSLWRDVVFINSNQVITPDDNGKMFVVDSSGGAVAITLPQISSITTPFNIGVKKESSDLNNVTINRSGTDLIDGETSKIIATPGNGTVLIADTDPSPDAWTAADFGAAAGQMKVAEFTGDGVTTAFNLPSAPGSAANCWPTVNGVDQHYDQFTVNGLQIIFTVAPPAPVTPGEKNINVRFGTTLSIGIPADGSGTTDKHANKSVTYAKMQDISAASRLLGRGSDAGAGSPQELSLGDGLKMDGTVVRPIHTGHAYAERTANITVSTAIPNDNTIPQSNEGTEVLSVNYTVKDIVNSVIKIDVDLPVWTSSTNSGCIAVFSSDSTDAIKAVSFSPNSSAIGRVSVEFVPPSVGAKTFSVRVGPQNSFSWTLPGPVNLFGLKQKATLTVDEYRIQ